MLTKETHTFVSQRRLPKFSDKCLTHQATCRARRWCSTQSFSDGGKRVLNRGLRTATRGYNEDYPCQKAWARSHKGTVSKYSIQPHSPYMLLNRDVAHRRFVGSLSHSHFFMEDGFPLSWRCTDCQVFRPKASGVPPGPHKLAVNAHPIFCPKGLETSTCQQIGPMGMSLLVTAGISYFKMPPKCATCAHKHTALELQ